GDEEGGGDGGGVKGKDGLQDQRGADAGIDGGMGAGEHQREPLVGNIARRCGRQLLGHHSQLFEGALAAARRRNASTVLRRATAMSHASALSGIPPAGQSTSAAAKASDKASSAPATSPVRAARKAMSLP